MPSSPPIRAWDNQHQRQQPASPTDSQYSIDLNALELDSHSGASTPLPTQHVDKVLSEDIDGPSDFTQNMEAWMRGGKLRKNDGGGTLKGTSKDLTEKPDEDAHRADAVESVEPISLAQEGCLVEDEQAESRHTPSNSPPKESVSSDRIAHDDEGDEEVSSDWDPYAEAATPHPPFHKQQSLQPLVEDYHSEFTPARMPSFSPPRSVGQDRHDDEPEEEQSVHKSRENLATPGRPSSPTLSPIHSPIFHRSAAPVGSLRQFSSQTDEAAFERQLHDLREKCLQIEQLNTTLSQSLEEERRLRRQDSATHEAQVADAARRENALSEMKDQAYTHKEDFRRESAELKEGARRHQTEWEAKEREIEGMKMHQATEEQRVKEHMGRESAEHSRTVRKLEQDLDLARRGRDGAEDSARMLRDELEECRGGNDVELDRMRLDLDQVDDLRDRVAELEEEVGSLKEENEPLAAAKQLTDDTTRNLRAELAILKQTQNEETTRITADHRRAVDLAGVLQSKYEELQQQLRDQQAVHDVEMERVRNEQQTQPAAKDAEQAENLRRELEAQRTALYTAILERDAAQDSLTSTQSDLNAAILDRDTVQDSLTSAQSDLNAAILDRDVAQDTLQRLQAEFDTLKLALDDRDGIDQTLDKRVSDAIRKREAYWRERLAEAEVERRLMAKALLRLWGREEIGGAEDPQAYLYKYLRRNGEGKMEF